VVALQGIARLQARGVGMPRIYRLCGMDRWAPIFRVSTRPLRTFLKYAQIFPK
jgi:hypothetical protein